MPSVQESIDRVTAFYSNHAPYFHQSAYGEGRSEPKHARLRRYYQEALEGHVVLELAAGSGYWTEAVASTAQRIVATDVHPNLVEVIGSRLQRLPNVQCQVADAYSLDGVTEDFTAAFAQYWWSHIPRKRLSSFLATLHSSCFLAHSSFFRMT
jgi:protein-L-isoaspartate O-methyltransferase